MKKSKQLQILELFKLKLYRCENDKVYKRKNGLWRQLKINTQLDGYKQITFIDELGDRIICYLHVAVYLYHSGQYDEWMQIDHLDRNKNNNLPINLECKTVSANRLNTVRPTKYKPFKTIRSAQIKLIRQYILEGANQSQIAKKLNLNRLSVRYIVKQIEAKKTLKYE